MRRITQVRIIDRGESASWRAAQDHLFVRVESGSHYGLYGPVAISIAELIAGRFANLVCGLDPFDHDRMHALWGSQVNRDALDSCAIGSLDCALWDLHGRMEGVPVSQLISLNSATRVRAYMSWLGLDVRLPDAIHQISLAASEDWATTKWALRKHTTGPATEEEASTLAGFAIRAANAAEAPVAIDALGTWDETTVIRFAHHIAPSAISWLEDPLPPQASPAEYRRLSISSVPIGLGEHIHTIAQADSMLGSAAPAVFTPDVVRLGGITVANIVLRLARKARIRTYLHGRALVPALHVAAAFPDLIAAVEYQRYWERQRQQFFKLPLAPDNGWLRVPSDPGLGLALRN